MPVIHNDTYRALAQITDQMWAKAHCSCIFLQRHKCRCKSFDSGFHTVSEGRGNSFRESNDLP